MLTGVVSCAHGLAVFTLPLGVTKPSQRRVYLPIFASAGGLSFAVSAATGGAALERLSGHLDVLGLSLVGLHALFMASALARVLGATLVSRIAPSEAEARGDVRRVARFAVDTARASLARAAGHR